MKVITIYACLFAGCAIIIYMRIYHWFYAPELTEHRPSCPSGLGTPLALGLCWSPCCFKRLPGGLDSQAAPGRSQSANLP